MEFQVLIINAGRDGETRSGLPECRSAQDGRVAVICITLPIGRILPALAVDPARVVAAIGAEANAERTFDDRHADRDATFITGAAMLDRVDRRPAVDVELAKAGRRSYKADRAALRACPEQGSLRPAQNFHPLEVEQEGQGGTIIVERRIAGHDRRVVDVNRRSGRARGRIDAADGNARLTRATCRCARNIEAGRLVCDIADVANTALVEAFLAVCGNGNRHLRGRFRTLRSRHDDVPRHIVATIGRPLGGSGDSDQQ